jgi:DNA modification methylase
VKESKGYGKNMDKDIREISALTPYAKNPRKINKRDFLLLKKHIKERGQFKPIVINQDGVICGGNMRYLAYKELGISKVWVSEVKTKSEKDIIEYNLLDNQRFGYYDDDLLAELTFPLKDEINFADFSVDTREPFILEDLISNYAPDNENDDAVPEPPKKPKTKTGDLYQLGEHRLLCGDATKKEDMEKLMNGEKSDMVFTDPPYGLGYEYNSYSDIKGNKYLEFCDNWFPNVKDSPLVLITTGWKYHRYWQMKEPRDLMYWLLPNKQTGGTLFHYRRIEPIYVWGKGKKKYDFDYFVNNSDRHYGLRELHTCPKPVGLIESIIKAVNAKDIVLDVFGGSGSTLIACEKLNRKCRMMEIDPVYCDVIVKRWEDFTGKKAEKIK